MAGGNLLRKAKPALDSQEDCGVISTRQEGHKRRNSSRQKRSRNPPQRRNARARNDVAPYSPAMGLCFIDGVRRAQATARRSGAAGTAAASGTASGMDTRCPVRAGQRQRSRLCAEHDSPPGRPGYQPANQPTSQRHQVPRKRNSYFITAPDIIFANGGQRSHTEGSAAGALP